MKTVFITERPTQIVTALAICDSFNLNSEIKIFVADCFDDAKAIMERFSYIYKNISFQYAKNYDEAVKMVITELPAHIFVHWDVGFRNQKKLRFFRDNNKGNKISVFEEGVGTYRQNIYKPFKKVIFRLAGLPVNVGGSSYIDDIYVFNRNKYISKATSKPHNVIQIKTSLQNFITIKQKQLVTIFSADKTIEYLRLNGGTLCSIYLSSWDFDESKMIESLPDHDVKILKLHPHCKVVELQNDIYIAPTSLPAELLIIAASRFFDFVTIYHYGSSVSQYIDINNIKFINLNDSL